MRKIAQCELITVAAGVSPDTQAQPKAGIGEMIGQTIVTLVITAIWDYLWSITKKDEKKDEKKDARHGHSSSRTPF